MAPRATRPLMPAESIIQPYSSLGALRLVRLVPCIVRCPNERPKELIEILEPASGGLPMSLAPRGVPWRPETAPCSKTWLLPLHPMAGRIALDHFAITE